MVKYITTCIFTCEEGCGQCDILYYIDGNGINTHTHTGPLGFCNQHFALWVQLFIPLLAVLQAPQSSICLLEHQMWALKIIYTGNFIHAHDQINNQPWLVISIDPCRRRDSSSSSLLRLHFPGDGRRRMSRMWWRRLTMTGNLPPPCD